MARAPAATTTDRSRRRVALPRRERRHLGARRARAARRRRLGDLGADADAPARALPRAPDFPRARRRPGAVALGGRVRDPARRPPARAGALAGGAAVAPAIRGQRRQPVAGADVGLAGDDARGAGDARAHRRRNAGPRRGARRRTAVGRVARRALAAGPLRRTPRHFLGPAHGFAGNVPALARGGAARRPDRRASSSGAPSRCAPDYAKREDGLAQWPPRSSRAPPRATRDQWCHGAPGSSPRSRALAPRRRASSTELLLAGGELTWRAGPLAKGPGLCHGTAGNGYAFLKLFERTGDELWLDRARAFAMHAAGAGRADA